MQQAFGATPVIAVNAEGHVTEEFVKPRKALGNEVDVTPTEPIAFPFRDPVGELEAKRKTADAVEQALYPALVKARRAWEKAARTLAFYGRELRDLRQAADQAQREASGTSPDSAHGVRQQRQAHARALAAQVTEAALEFDAAKSEYDVAEAAWREALAEHSAQLERKA